MRELLFTLTYHPGWNAIADTLATHPEASIRSLSLHVTRDSLWRVDHATGTSSVSLEAIAKTFLTTEYYADCLATDACGAIQTTEVLDHRDDTLVLYSYWERTPHCASVPHIALEYLGEGALFETHHEGRTYTWRIIHSGTGDTQAFFDEVEEVVDDTAEIEIKRLAEAMSPISSNPRELSPSQQATLEAAVDHGYYETPRQVTVAELAETLSVPRSTLNYRLRRAEASLAKQYTEDTLPSSSAPRQ